MNKLSISISDRAIRNVLKEQIAYEISDRFDDVLTDNIDLVNDIIEENLNNYLKDNMGKLIYDIIDSLVKDELKQYREME